MDYLASCMTDWLRQTYLASPYAQYLMEYAKKIDAYEQREAALEAKRKLEEARRGFPMPEVTFPLNFINAIPDDVGCYAFIDGRTKTVLRVGQSVRLHQRICQYLFRPKSDRATQALHDHMHSSKETYDAMRVVVWLTRDLDGFETALLNKFTPPFNVVGGRFPRKGR